MKDELMKEIINMIQKIESVFILVKIRNYIKGIIS